MFNSYFSQVLYSLKCISPTAQMTSHFISHETFSFSSVTLYDYSSSVLLISLSLSLIHLLYITVFSF